MAKENDASNAASNGANQNGTTAPRAKEVLNANHLLFWLLFWLLF